MTDAELFNQVHHVFKIVFNDPELPLTRTTSAADIAEWDSLNHITLIAMIEGQLNIRFNVGELGNLNNVGEMLDLIEKKLKKE